MDFAAPSQKNVMIKLLSCTFLISLYFMRISNNVVDPDLWHQMALIREAILLGHIPLNDHFAYTPTIFPSVHHEWGAGLVAYLLATRFGAPGILAVKYLLALCMAAFFLACFRRRSVTIEILILLAPIGILLIDEGFSAIRGQLYSFTFSLCLLWCLERDRDGDRKWIAVWIPLYIIWVNIHGGFLVGAGLFGAYWLERLFRREPHLHLLVIGLVMLGLIGLNPYGTSYYKYLWHAITMPRPYIKEWYPIWSGLNLLHLCIFFVSVIFLVYSIKKIGIGHAQGILLIISSGVAAIFCTRLVLFYAIVWTFFVPGYLQITPFRNVMYAVLTKRSTFLILFLSIATIALFVRAFSFHPWRLVVPADHIRIYGEHPIYPVGPVKYLKETGFKGNLMVPFDWGSYVTWKLYPDVRVSMDSRYEAAYPDWLVDENIQFYYGKLGWRGALNKYDTDLVLLHRNLPLAKVMPDQKGWKKIYTDKGFELYARQGLTLPAVDWTDRVSEGTFP